MAVTKEQIKELDNVGKIGEMNDKANGVKRNWEANGYNKQMRKLTDQYTEQQRAKIKANEKSTMEEAAKEAEDQIRHATGKSKTFSLGVTEERWQEIFGH